MSNKAAYITEAKASPLQVKEAPLPSAGKGEIVVKNHATAVNPVDCKYPKSCSWLDMANVAQGRFRTTVCYQVDVEGLEN